MTVVSSLSSNKTQLSIAEEDSLGVLPATRVWTPYEPNGYDDFGGEITTAPRKPIKSDRMGRKGPVVDIEAKAGFNTDITYTNLFELFEGFLFAAARRKVEKINTAGTEITLVTASSETFTVDADGDDFLANDLVLTSGFTNAANNALFTVNTSTGTTVVVTENVTVDETPPTDAKMVVVGHQFATADAEIVAPASAFPTLTASKDLTQLGILPGEVVYIGGDAAVENFATAANNGWARVRSVAAGVITFDKTEGTMVTDSGSGKTIRIYLPRVLKNETGASIVRKSFQIERQLGAPEDSLPGAVQSEYITGAVCSEIAVNIPEAEKVNADVSFMGLDHETRSSATGVKSGTRGTLVADDVFNSSSSIPRISLSVVSTTNSNPTDFVSHLSELTLSVNNNLARNIGIGTTGAFEMTEGDFGVELELEAFFQNVSALASVRSNDDLTIGVNMVQGNQGIAIDIPLLAGSGALANVEADTPIKLPLTSQGANGIDIDSTLNHIMMMCFFDYLPTVAAS